MKNHNKSTSKYNFLFTLNNPKISPDELIKKFSTYENLKFAIFQKEKGDTLGTEHFQGYLEFYKKESYKNINLVIFDNLAYLEERKGTQQQAIDYCKKKDTRISDKYYEYGTKKISYNTYNIENPDIPQDREEQWIYLEQKIIDGTYVHIDDIHKDFPYLVIHFDKKIQNLLYKHQPQDFAIPPAKVIYLWGESGAGKTVWTINYLRSLNLDLKDVCKRKSPNDKTPKLWFDADDRNKSVLWIEEVRENFPNKNDVIKLIDRNDILETKHGHIRNNFKLIIFNSLLPPWKVYPTEKSAFLYRPISPQEQQEVLRRIFMGKIIHIERNQPLLNELKGLEYSEFITKYKPLEKTLTDGSDNQLYLKYCDKE